MSSSNEDHFYASFDDNNTKVSFLDCDLCWMSDDRIMVFSSPVGEQYRFDGMDYLLTGSFSKVEGSPAASGAAFEKHYAFTPFNSGLTCSEEGVFNVPLPSEQHFAEGKYGSADNLILAAKTKNIQDKNLRFGMVQGLLGFSIATLDGFPIKEIVLEGNNGEVLSGTAGVTFDGQGKPVVAVPEEGGKTITLDCSKNTNSTNDYVNFCIALPPLTFEKGFTITITDESGEKYVKSTAKAIAVSRNTYSSMERFSLQGTDPKPKIGLTHYSDVEKNNTNYHKAIIQAGGIPVNLPPIKTEKEALAQIQAVDGIFIPGSTYTEYEYADKTLPKLAIQNHKWVMGICHGCQYINISLGGDRVLTTTVPGAANHKFSEYQAIEKHRINVDHSSRMYEILGVDELGVNSLHTYCVGKLAPGVKVVAWADDGVVPEAIEGEYFMGYQFHPECWAKDGTRPYLNLFEDFIKKVKSTMQ